MRLSGWMMLGALVISAASEGCIIIGSGSSQAYELCTTSSDCAGVLLCRTPNSTIAGSSTRDFCTQSCSTSASCPRNGVCVVSGGSGQCYASCAGGGTCPTGSVCGSIGGVSICVPSTGTQVTCGASGQACCTGATPCNSGLTCGTGNVCGVACGGIGQPCCTGQTCNANQGLACGTDGNCNLSPYSGCSSASIGASCLTGSTTGGLPVQTSCQRPMVSNPAANGFCTATCTAAMAECPREAITGRTFGCYILQGTTTGQCYMDCNQVGDQCPPNTECKATTSATGATIFLCMP